MKDFDRNETGGSAGGGATGIFGVVENWPAPSVAGDPAGVPSVALPQAMSQKTASSPEAREIAPEALPSGGFTQLLRTLSGPDTNGNVLARPTAQAGPSGDPERAFEAAIGDVRPATIKLAPEAAPEAGAGLTASFNPRIGDLRDPAHPPGAREPVGPMTQMFAAMGSQRTDAPATSQGSAPAEQASPASAPAATGPTESTVPSPVAERPGVSSGEFMRLFQELENPPPPYRLETGPVLSSAPPVSASYSSGTHPVVPAWAPATAQQAAGEPSSGGFTQLFRSLEGGTPVFPTFPKAGSSPDRAPLAREVPLESKPAASLTSMFQIADPLAPGSTSSAKLPVPVAPLAPVQGGGSFTQLFQALETTGGPAVTTPQPAAAPPSFSHFGGESLTDIFSKGGAAPAPSQADWFPPVAGAEQPVDTAPPLPPAFRTESSAPVYREPVFSEPYATPAPLPLVGAADGTGELTQLLRMLDNPSAAPSFTAPPIGVPPAPISGQPAYNLYSAGAVASSDNATVAFQRPSNESPSAPVPVPAPTSAEGSYTRIVNASVEREAIRQGGSAAVSGAPAAAVPATPPSLLGSQYPSLPSYPQLPQTPQFPQVHQGGGGAGMQPMHLPPTPQFQIPAAPSPAALIPAAPAAGAPKSWLTILLLVIIVLLVGILLAVVLLMKK